MTIAASSRSSSNALHLHLGRRFLPRASSPRFEGAAALTTLHINHAHGVVASSPSTLAVNNASIFSFRRQHQFQPKSSMGVPSMISRSNSTSAFDTPTYSFLRNNITMPFENKSGRRRGGGGVGRPDYTSPYSQFFNNIEAGRTSLGTTKAMEQRVFELQEQRLQCGIPESELRFRTVSYGRFALPPYVAPGEHRVTVKVALSAIPFENDNEKEIFLEIVGSRYNPKKGDLQLSSEKFASRIENKRYLVDMIEKIVMNARKLAKEFDAEDGKAKATAK